MATILGLRDGCCAATGASALYSPAKEKAANRGVFNSRSPIRRFRQFLSAVKIKLLLTICFLFVLLFISSKADPLMGWIPPSSSSLSPISRDDIILIGDVADKNNKSPGMGEHGTTFPNTIGTVVFHFKKDEVVSICVRRGGIDIGQPHNQWLSTVSQAPDVIAMSFVPITSLLNGVPGSGFLTHAVNLYLRYKPAIEELHQFLEFQLPRQWAPVFGELPLGPQRKQPVFPSLQFSLMGPKLYVNTVQVDAGKRPLTGIRLYLEGKRSDRLGIHLQHLSSLPKILQLSNDDNGCESNEPSHKRGYYEPVKWSLFSHVCTAPVEYNGTRIDDSASIVTKAWFVVRDMGMKKVLFLRLGFCMVAAAKIRRSEWDGTSSLAQKSGIISSFISTRFSTGQIPAKKPDKVEMNSAVFPHGPPVPARSPRMLRFVDTTEMTRGPEDLPGYWVVTGAKLCIEGGKISLRVKYSLLTIMSDEDT